MATAYVEELRSRFAKSKFVIGHADKQIIHWSEVFENNPYMLQKGERYDGELVFVPDYPGNRAYVDNENSDSSHFAFNPGFAAPVGKIYFSDEEQQHIENLKKEMGENFVIIEPNVKGNISGDNKAWGWNKWQRLIERTRGQVSWFQVGTTSTGRILKHVWRRPTPRFRGALMVLAASKGFVGTDGGMHHAAAALGKRAVVVWGHYTSPNQLGYEGHLNIVPDNPPKVGCGRFQPCEDCRKAMESISEATVHQAVLEAFGK